MTDPAQAPTVEMIERRFSSAPVVLARPVIHGGLGFLSMVRGFTWTAKGAERLLQIRGPFIMASNHSSHADTAAIMGTLPPSLRRRSCVAAALDVFGPAERAAGQPLQVFKRECLQIVVAAGFGAFGFDRHGPSLRSIRTAATLVRKGWNLLLYPEGTRSRDGHMEAFKSGVGVLAKKTGRPVVPVHVSGGNVVLPIGQTVPQSGHIRVRFGEPLSIAEGESTAEFVQRLQERVRTMAPGKCEIRDSPAPSDGTLLGLRP